MARLTIEDAKRVAKDRNGECLSENYINSSSKLKWQCKKGHIWDTPYQNIKQKTWCPHCAINQKKTIKDAQQLALNRNGYCLSNSYTNSQTRMEWECDKKHRFIRTYSDVQQGKWCSSCAGVKYKYHTLKECCDVAKKKGGKCLSIIYTNSRIKMKWQCDKNHIWKAPYSEINIGSWCRKCVYVGRKNTIKDAKKLAKSQNGKCLSSEYVSSKSKLKWQCNKDHIWEAPYGSIQTGRWCPKCRNKTQNKFAEIIQDLLGVEVIQNYRGFDWLKNDKTKMKQEIDIYVPSFKLAIEYQGQQHYMPVCFGGMSKKQAENNFRKTKKLDNIKRKKLHKYKKDIKIFIFFTYKNPPTKEFVRQILIDNNILKEEK